MTMTTATATKPVKKAPLKRPVKKDVASVATASTVKKAPAKKAAPAKVAAPTRKAPPVKKVAAKKVPAKPIKKVAAKAERAPRADWREYDENGFMVGSASATIADILIAGGESRNDINARVAEAIGDTTRTGQPKNTAAVVSGMIHKLLARGFTVESSYRLVPPAKGGKR